MAEKSKGSSSKRGGRRPGAGRPSYKPSIEERLVVEQMKFCGEPDAVIARALKIDEKTLKKHFADELAGGHASRRREVVELLFKSARAGNVSAQKRLDEMGRAAGAQEAVNRRGRREPDLGKKEQAQAAAEAVTGKFAPPPAPKLVIDNGRRGEIA